MQAFYIVGSKYKNSPGDSSYQDFDPDETPKNIRDMDYEGAQPRPQPSNTNPTSSREKRENPENKKS